VGGIDAKQTSIISTEETFLALEDRWTKLVERSESASVFQTFAWQTIWWRFFGHDQQLRIIIAECNGDLVGILPLYVEHCTDLLPAVGLRRLRLIGYGGDTTPDDLGPMIAGEDPSAEMEALMRGLHAIKDEWDIALFEDLDPASPFIPLVQQQLGDKIDLDEGMTISYTELPDSWDGFLATCSQRRRWKLRRGRTKLAEHSPYRFLLVKTQEELDTYYPELVRLHRDRWSGSPGMGGFSTQAYIEFHRAVTRAMLEQNSLRLMFLINDEGAAIAANYCYHWRGAFYGFQMGFALDHQHLRVGEVLMGHAIEQAIHEGMDIFDMLRGDHDYKQWLTNKSRQRVNLLVHRPTMRTISYKLLRAGYRKARQLAEFKAGNRSMPTIKEADISKPAA